MQSIGLKNQILPVFFHFKKFCYQKEKQNKLVL